VKGEKKLGIMNVGDSREAKISFKRKKRIVVGKNLVYS